MSFKQWSFASKWAVISSAAAIIVLLAQVAGALTSLEPYFLATRGWVRAEAVAVAREQAAQLQLAQDQTAATLKILVMQQLSTQKLIYDGQERDLRAELVDIDIRLKASPDDTLLLRRRADVVASLDEIARSQSAVSCQLRRSQSPGQTC